MKRLTICVLLYSVLCSAQGTKRPSILGNAHMAVYVSDLARARVFYEDFLGYAEPYSLKNKEGDATRIAFVKINEDQYLELFAEKSREEGLQLNHISFQTSDAEDCILKTSSALLMLYLQTRAASFLGPC